MIAEETKLAIGAISKLVGVGAGRQVITGTAKVDPNPLLTVFSVVRLRVAIAATLTISKSTE